MGIIINGTKYIHLMDDNNLKKQSLNDNVYFTLRDIFKNADDIRMCFIVNDYNNLLTNGVCLEDRTSDFEYANVLYTKKYVTSLSNYLSNFHISYFEFNKPNDDEEIDMLEYMKFDDWWIQFEELKYLISEQNRKIE